MIERRASRWLKIFTIVAVASVTSAAGAAPAPARQQTFFITPTWGSLSSPLGWRHDPFGATLWDYHWGIDIAAPMGTPVVASATGLVRYAASYGGYGGTIVLEHAGGWATVYGHLGLMAVKLGQQVPQAAVIGTIGNNGHSTGPHLHFEIRYRGIPVNPLQYLDR